MKKKKKQFKAEKGGIIRITKQVMDEEQFNKLIVKIKAGEVRPYDRAAMKRKPTLQKPHSTVVNRQHMHSLEDVRYTFSRVYPVYIVDVHSQSCQTVYLSKDQTVRLLEVKASIQRPVKPVQPIDSDEDKKAEGGSNK